MDMDMCSVVVCSSSARARFVTADVGVARVLLEDGGVVLGELRLGSQSGESL